MITLEHARGGIAGPTIDFKEVFGPRHRGEPVAPHVHDEPTPRVPDYDEIARLVSPPVHQEQALPAGRPDADDGERGTPVPAR
jgi:hypothetical protein